MALWDRIKGLDKTFAWSFFGFFLGVGGIGFGVWSYYNSPSPKLIYEVLTNTPVLDIREDIDTLEILYDGQDITDSDRSLQVITFRVVNSGRVDILKGSYDSENAPLGIQLSEGEIVQIPRILASSSQYISDNLKPTVVTPTQIQFNTIILNSEDYFTIKILALVPSEDVRVKPLGIIAGIKEIELVESYREGGDNKRLSDQTSNSELRLPSLYNFILSLGGILGGFAGLISLVFNRIVSQKDEIIHDLEQSLEASHENSAELENNIRSIHEEDY